MRVTKKIIWTRVRVRVRVRVRDPACQQGPRPNQLRWFGMGIIECQGSGCDLGES